MALPLVRGSRQKLREIMKRAGSAGALGESAQNGASVLQPRKRAFAPMPLLPMLAVAFAMAALCA
jgi:hypothetical protein